MKTPPPHDLEAPDAPDLTRQGTRQRINVMSISIVGLFFLASAYTIYLIRPVVLPLIYALLLTLVLKPIHRRMGKYFRFPAPLSAFVVLLAFAAASVGVFTYLSAPVVTYSKELRAENVKARLSRIFQPLSAIQGEIANVAEEMDKITSKGDGSASTQGQFVLPNSLPFLLTPKIPSLPTPAAIVPPPRIRIAPLTKSTIENGSGIEVEVTTTSDETESSKKATNTLESGVEVMVSSDEGDMSVRSSDEELKVKSDKPPVSVQIRDDPLDEFYAFAQDFTFHFTVTLALVFFFLAFGDTMIRRLAEVDVAASFLEDLTQDVSYYLFTITVINIGLGIAIGVAMWSLGMPNPILWGVLAALLNFVPYIGALAGTAIVFLVAAITFDQTRDIIPVPIVYYLLTAIEGNFVTPMIIGKRFTINPIIVFLWVICWGTMWGIPGMLIALPLLMVFRIVCSKVPSLARVERIISI